MPLGDTRCHLPNSNKKGAIKLAISSSYAKIPFAAGVVGSLPRPEHVKNMLPDIPGAESVIAAGSLAMDTAVRYAINMQEMAGLDLVSDGEWRRHAYTHVIADIVDGFTADNRESPHRWGISVTSPMEIKRSGLIAKEAQFLVESTTKATKVCIPSPYLLGVRLWEKTLSSAAYPTRDEFIEALVPILRNELIAVQSTGVTIVQIDEPHLCVLVDENYRGLFDDPMYEMEFAVDKINQLIDGIENVMFSLHLCRRNWGRQGWGAEGGYEPILDAINKINVDQYVMEFSIPAAGDYSILKNLREDSLIGLGAVDCRFEDIESPETIVARVEEAMKYVDRDRLSINPDCGFSPGMQTYMSIDEPYLKLKNESLAAHILRNKYS